MFKRIVAHMGEWFNYAIYNNDHIYAIIYCRFLFLQFLTTLITSLSSTLAKNIDSWFGDFSNLRYECFHLVC